MSKTAETLLILFVAACTLGRLIHQFRSRPAKSPQSR